MKRLLVVLMCAFALTYVGFLQARGGVALAQEKKDQKEVTNYDIYIGQYEVSPGFMLTVTNENGKLMGQPTGDEKAEFKAEAGPDEFFSSTVGARLKFARDQAGVVNAVVVTIDGKDFYSKKIK